MPTCTSAASRPTDHRATRTNLTCRACDPGRSRYPQLVLYVDVNDHIDVWCVLDGKRDLPQWMLEPGEV